MASFSQTGAGSKVMQQINIDNDGNISIRQEIPAGRKITNNFSNAEAALIESLDGVVNNFGSASVTLNRMPLSTNDSEPSHDPRRVTGTKEPQDNSSIKDNEHLISGGLGNQDVAPTNDIPRSSSSRTAEAQVPLFVKTILQKGKDRVPSLTRGGFGRISKACSSAPKQFSTKIISSQVFVRGAKAASFAQKPNSVGSIATHTEVQNDIQSDAADRVSQRPQTSFHIATTEDKSPANSNDNSNGPTEVGSALALSATNPQMNSSQPTAASKQQRRRSQARLRSELCIDGTSALTDGKIVRGVETVRKDRGGYYVVRSDNSWATTKDKSESDREGVGSDSASLNAAPGTSQPALTTAATVSYSRRLNPSDPASTLKQHQVRTKEPSENNNRKIDQTVVAALNIKCQNVSKADLTQQQLDQQNAGNEPDQVVMLYPCRALFHNTCLGEYCIQDQDVEKARTVPNEYELEHGITPPSPIEPPSDTRWRERKDRWVGIDSTGMTHTILKSKGNAVNCPTCRKTILPSGHDIEYGKLTWTAAQMTEVKRQFRLVAGSTDRYLQPTDGRDLQNELLQRSDNADDFVRDLLAARPAPTKRKRSRKM